MDKIFNQFYLNILNQHVEVSDDTNKYQCQDLAYLWTFCLGFPKATIQHLYAKEVYTKATDLTRKYFEVIPNTPTGIPQAGDLVVFDSTSANIAGHISIANGKGNTKSFESLDQNWQAGQKTTIITHNYDAPKVLGWLRAKLPTSNSQCEVDLAEQRKQVSNLQSQVNGLLKDKTDLNQELTEANANAKGFRDQFNDLVAKLASKLSTRQEPIEILAAVDTCITYEDKAEELERLLIIEKEEHNKAIESLGKELSSVKSQLVSLENKYDDLVRVSTQPIPTRSLFDIIRSIFGK